MKLYEMLSQNRSYSIGIVLYCEKEKSYIAELKSNLDSQKVPALFKNFVENGIFTMPRNISLQWVQENNKSLERTDFLPNYVQKRILHNLTECVALEDDNLLCFFADRTIRKIDLKTIPQALETSVYQNIDVGKLLKTPMLIRSAKVGIGGYYITFENKIDLPSWLLYRSGKKIPLEPEAFLAFVQKNILDTTEACNELGCSRQNLSYLVSQEMLTPLKENAKGNLYLKGDILRSQW